jgi:hypothetical protein
LLTSCCVRAADRYIPTKRSDARCGPDLNFPWSGTQYAEARAPLESSRPIDDEAYACLELSFIEQNGKALPLICGYC